MAQINISPLFNGGEITKRAKIDESKIIKVELFKAPNFTPRGEKSMIWNSKIKEGIS
jgi:hypothetical protein